MREETARIAIKVVPGASRDGVVGWLGDALKIRVVAPPERGRANAAVERVLAAALGVPVESVRIVAGSASARKTVLVTGVSETEIRQRIRTSIE